MRALPHVTSVSRAATSVRGPAQLVSAAGVDHEASCERRLAAPPVAQLRRAYYATVSYVDSLVGALLAKLDATAMHNDTAVVFIGDQCVAPHASVVVW